MMRVSPTPLINIPQTSCCIHFGVEDSKGLVSGLQILSVKSVMVVTVVFQVFILNRKVFLLNGSTPQEHAVIAVTAEPQELGCRHIAGQIKHGTVSTDCQAC